MAARPAATSCHARLVTLPLSPPHTRGRRLAQLLHTQALDVQSGELRRELEAATHLLSADLGRTTREIGSLRSDVAAAANLAKRVGGLGWAWQAESAGMPGPVFRASSAWLAATPLLAACRSRHLIISFPAPSLQHAAPCWPPAAQGTSSAFLPPPSRALPPGPAGRNPLKGTHQLPCPLPPAPCPHESQAEAAGAACCLEPRLVRLEAAVQGQPPPASLALAAALEDKVEALAASQVRMRACVCVGVCGGVWGVIMQASIARR